MRRNILKVLSKFSLFFPLLGPKGPAALIKQSESPSPKHVPTKFGWNWSSDSWEEVV